MATAAAEREEMQIDAICTLMVTTSDPRVSADLGLYIAGELGIDARRIRDALQQKLTAMTAANN